MVIVLKISYLQLWFEDTGVKNSRAIERESCVILLYAIKPIILEQWRIIETLNRSKHWELHTAETHFKIGYLLSCFNSVGNIIYSVSETDKAS